MQRRGDDQPTVFTDHEGHHRSPRRRYVQSSTACRRASRDGPGSSSSTASGHRPRASRSRWSGAIGVLARRLARGRGHCRSDPGHPRGHRRSDRHDPDADRIDDPVWRRNSRSTPPRRLPRDRGSRSTPAYRPRPGVVTRRGGHRSAERPASAGLIDYLRRRMGTVVARHPGAIATAPRVSTSWLRRPTYRRGAAAAGLAARRATRSRPVADLRSATGGWLVGGRGRGPGWVRPPAAHPDPDRPRFRGAQDIDSFLVDWSGTCRCSSTSRSSPPTSGLGWRGRSSGSSTTTATPS